MLRSIKHSLIIFLVVLILPTIVFSIYEIGTLRDNEQIIESIYNNQLDAILFSINQYTEDIVTDWASDLSSLAENHYISGKDVFLKKLQELPATNGYLQFDENLDIQVSVFKFPEAKQLINDVTRWLTENDSLLTRMETYLRGGYNRIETHPSFQDQTLYALFTSSADNSTLYHVLLLNPVDFINKVVDPKIQEIAQDQFYITAFRTGSDSVIYSSDKQYNPVSVTHRKEFWLLQNYTVGIELRDTTINELARSRSKKDLLLIGIVDLILILGIGIIYFNMKKQMELSQLKTDFISNVSHEIRTPLALISMYIETLEMDRVNSKEKVKEYYQIILQETQRLSGIVNKILSFSQIENKKRTYTFSPTNINNIVCTTAAIYKFSLESKGFKYTIECSEDLPEVNVDGEAVADALVNLIDNATKYSDKEKEINIATGYNNDWIYIEVSDKGIGISDNERKHIFDKFYRVTEKNLALKAKGSGLGLAIVKHIMDSHSGLIQVTSQKGKGSTFKLMFPLK